MSFIGKNFLDLINKSSGLLKYRQLLNAKTVRCFAIEEIPAQTEDGKTLKNGKLLISESGMKRLKELCTDGSFLRVTVEGGGCSGFQYKFALDKNLEKDDLQFGEDQAKIVIDNISLEYCAGATLDYHSELIRSGFRIIENPLAGKGCSCGASFSMKIDLGAT